MEDWWKATARHYGQVFSQAEYPIVVENFLTATWARRLNQQMPEPELFLFPSPATSGCAPARQQAHRPSRGTTRPAVSARS